MKTCCSMKLRTAGFVTAWLNIIICVLLLVFLPQYYLSYQVEKMKNDFSTISDSDSKEFEALHFEIYQYSMAVTILWLVASVLLPIGILFKYHLLLIPWLIQAITAIVILIPAGILAIFQFSFNLTIASAGVVLLNLISIGLLVWLTNAMISLFKELRDKKKLMETPYIVPYGMDAVPFDQR